MQALASDTVGVKVIAAEAGPVTERDVEQAHALGAHLLAFNVRAAGPAVAAAAKNLGVDILHHRVIYRLLEEVRGNTGMRPAALHADSTCMHAFGRAHAMQPVMRTPPCVHADCRPHALAH